MLPNIRVHSIKELLSERENRTAVEVARIFKYSNRESEFPDAIWAKLARAAIYELQRLQDEDLMKECLDAMLDDKLETQINEWEKVKSEELSAALSSLVVSDCNVENSLLNPLAAEFIPQSQLIIDLVTS